MKYGYNKKISLTFEDAVTKTKEELAKEGFGVLSEIDVKATMKKKLGVEYENYIIIGACNPGFAHQALQAEKEIGLLLPCNVIVYEEKGDVYVSAIIPSVTMSMVENERVAPVAKEVEDRLKLVIKALT